MRKPVSGNTKKTTLLQGLINSLENLDVASGSIILSYSQQQCLMHMLVFGIFRSSRGGEGL